MKGKGTPVKGTNAVNEPIFKNDWTPIHDDTPEARLEANGFEVLEAVLNPRVISQSMAIAREAVPTKPNSSPITDNIESVGVSGKNSYFCRD